MRTFWTLLATAFFAAVPATASASTVPPDAPGREITRWDQTFTLHADGSMDVRLEFDFDFGNDPGHGPYLVIPTRQGYDETYDRLYPLSDITAESTTGAPDTANLDWGRFFTEVKVGDPNIGDVSGVQTYVVTYSVGSVMNSTSAADVRQEGDGAIGDEFYWNAVGDGWAIPISHARVTVISPVGVTDVVCFAGAFRSTGACGHSEFEGSTAVFEQPYLAQGEPLTVGVMYPPGSFDTDPRLIESNDFTRAFDVTPVTLGGAGALLVGGLLVLVLRLRTSATDQQFVGLTPGLGPVGFQPGEVGRRDYKMPVAVQFEPPAGMRPGQLGTLIDEKADPRDVTATLVDLAVRGYLRIDDAGEVSSGLFSKQRDYTLVQLRPADAALFPFESALHAALFSGRTEVTLSDLKTTFASSMASVQTKLYENVTLMGWFRSNPRKARIMWALAGVGLTAAGVMGTFVLASASTYALIPLGLIPVGIATLVTTRNAPARAAAGTAALQQARGFELYITKAEANQLRFEEGEDLFSKYLPYAIAFGVADKWADKFAELARQGKTLAEPTWYGGGLAYGAFWLHAGTLGTQMQQFASSAESAMSAPTPGSSGGSGFSGGGGGFSGGGGGGGGGGGW